GHHLLGRRRQLHSTTVEVRPLVESREGKAMVVVFNGIKFRRYPDSTRRPDRVYYRPSSNYIKRGVGALHQEIWKAHYGPIPPGFHVHHKDGNPLNNDIANLQLLPVSTHMAMHGADGGQAARQYLNKARQRASEWHRSPAGRAWHREHGKRVWEQRQAVERRCQMCGETYYPRATH